MKYNGKNNPRVIIIQKIYSKLINNDLDLNFPKHRYKKFIKDVVNGTLERNEVIVYESNLHLNDDIDVRRIDKVFEVILKSAIFELLYKPTTSTNIIINQSVDYENIIITNNINFYSFANKLNQIEYMLQHNIILSVSNPMHYQICTSFLK